VQQKNKAQKLKDTRDYSFLLSEEAELPAPAAAPKSGSCLSSMLLFICGVKNLCFPLRNLYRFFADVKRGDQVKQ
jgi:hypothetical protein